MTSPPYPTVRQDSVRWAHLRGPLRTSSSGVDFVWMRSALVPPRRERTASAPRVTPLARASPGRRATGRWYVLAGACAIEVGSSAPGRLQAGDIAVHPRRRVSLPGHSGSERRVAGVRLAIDHQGLRAGDA